MLVLSRLISRLRRGGGTLRRRVSLSLTSTSPRWSTAQIADKALTSIEKKTQPSTSRRLSSGVPFNGYTIISTFPKEGSMNIGDLLIEHSTKRIIEDVKGGVEFNTIFRAENIEDYVSEINASRALVLACLAVRRDMVPKIYNFAGGLDKIKVPFVPIASGTRLTPAELTLDQMGARTEYDENTVAFLREISKRSVSFSCRGEVSFNFIRSKGIGNAIMTGDVAFYDPRFDGKEFKSRMAIGRIAVSSPGDGKTYSEQFYTLIEGLRSSYPSVEILILVHGASDWIDQARLSSFDASIRHIYQESLDALDVYSDFDLHIGYRVHAHVSALKRRVPSYLLAPDGRGYDYGKTLRTGSTWNAWRVRLNNSRYIVEADPDLIDYVLSVVHRDQASGFDRFSGFEREIAKFNKSLVEFVRRMP